MNRLVTVLFVTLIMTCFGAYGVNAKDDAKNEQVVEYSLAPAPHCQNCVNKIKGNLRFEKGVKNIEVDLDKKTVIIKYSPKSTSEEKLMEALKKIGYTATPFSGDCPQPQSAATCK